MRRTGGCTPSPPRGYSPSPPLCGEIIGEIVMKLVMHPLDRGCRGVLWSQNDILFPLRSHLICSQYYTPF